MSLPEPIQAPRPLSLAGAFEPVKLLNVTSRLHDWSDSAIESGPLMQVREDVRYLLASHLDYFKRYEKAERGCWYQVGAEGNGNQDISWREKVEELEAKLTAAKTMIALAEVHFDKTSPIVRLSQPYREAKEIVNS